MLRKTQVQKNKYEIEINNGKVIICRPTQKKVDVCGVVIDCDARCRPLGWTTALTGKASDGVY